MPSSAPRRSSSTRAAASTAPEPSAPPPDATPGSLHRLSEMEAAAPERGLSGDKAQRIVDAMRDSVAKRGAAGSTFEHVAGEAGVSRGLLHYYFGTKERLPVEGGRRGPRPRGDRRAQP